MSEHGPLGEALRAHRQRAGLTQQETAERAGLSVAAIRDLEQGRVGAPRRPTLRRLSLALGLTAAEMEHLKSQEAARRESANQIWIGVLGPLIVRVDGAAVDPGSEVQRVLLGLLALSPNLPVARDRLAGRIAVAGASVTTGGLAARISRLRRRLRPRTPGAGGPTIVAADGGYTLLVNEDQLDLLAFQALVRQARRHLAADELPRAWEQYAAAARLWRGEPLAGLGILADDPAVVGLTRQWPPVAADFAAVGAELGRYHEVVPVLRQAMEVDPLHELVHARLMVALAGTGRQAEALEVYDSLRRRLQRDLTAAPGPDLVEAHRQVLRHQVNRPRVATARARRTLPSDISEFTGRETELSRLSNGLAAFGDSSPVVVTVEGMGGIGKTRFAIHAARGLLAQGRFRGQQLYADLAGHTGAEPADPAGVLASFLHLLGIPSDEIPAGLTARSQLYQERLREAPALVLLDDAAGAAQVAPLLPEPAPGGPPIRCLVTSRRSLGTQLPGPGFTLPLPEFTEPEAVGLLAAIIGQERVAAEPAAARQLVAAGGRLPLAVSLVARRLAARPQWRLADLAARLADPRERLDQLAAGGRSVRAALAGSYRRLPGQIRDQLRRLAGHPEQEVTVESAAAYLGIDRASAQATLDRLRGEYLIAVPAAGRYRLHSLVRDLCSENCYREAW